MGGTASEALRHALMLFANPALVEPHRRAPVPDGMGELLRAACGQGELLEQQSALLGVSADKLEEAARFYVEQMLLSREVASDPWRVLGAERGAPEERLREHRQLLLRLVHPDRSSDWAEAYADRVQRAWRELKNGGSTPEPRVEAETPESDDWEVPSASPASWESVAPQPLHVEEPPHHEAMSSRSKWGLAGFGVLLLGLLFWGPQLEEALRGDDLQVLGGYDDSAYPAGEADDAAQSGSEPQTSGLVADPASSSGSAPPSAGTLAYPDPTADAESVAAAVTTRPAATRAAPTRPPVSGEAARSSGSAGGSEAVAAADPLPGPVPNQSVARDASRATGQTAQSSRAMQPTQIASTVPRQREERDAARSEPAGVARVAAQPRAQPGAVASQSPASRPVADAPEKASPEAATPALASTAPSGTQPSAPSRGAGAGVSVSQGAGQGATASAPATPAGSRPSLAQADATLGHFRRHYAAGDLAALLDLFADNANARRGGVPALRADYSALFGSTDSREIDFIDVRWQVVQNSLQGQGKFEVRLGRKGRFFKQKVSGRVNLEVVQTSSGPRLNRLEPIQGG